MKAMFKAWVVLVSVFGLLVVAMDPARADVGTDLTDIISTLPPGMVTWLGVITGVLYLIAQMRAVLPPSVTNKIPPVLMKLLDLVAANYKHASNGSTKPESVVENWDHGPTEKDGKYRAVVETAKNEGKLRGSSIENSGDSPGADNPGRKNA